MGTAAKKKDAEHGILARNLGTNVYRYRVMIVPKPSQQALARMAGVADETLRHVENSRNPAYPPYNASLKVIEQLAIGLRRLGADVTASDLLAMPSKPTGQPRHLRVIPGTGDALPL